MPKRPPQPVQQVKVCRHPVLGGGLGDGACQPLSDAGGLPQVGAFIEMLPPRTESLFRDRHDCEDEMVIILAGEVMRAEDQETPLPVGPIGFWPSVLAIGHCLHNRSIAEAQHLVIGTRRTRDVNHHPDHDLVTHKTGSARLCFRADERAC